MKKVMRFVKGMRHAQAHVKYTQAELYTCGAGLELEPPSFCFHLPSADHLPRQLQNKFQRECSNVTPLFSSIELPTLYSSMHFTLFVTHLNKNK